MIFHIITNKGLRINGLFGIILVRVSIPSQKAINRQIIIINKYEFVAHKPIILGNQLKKLKKTDILLIMGRGHY